MAKTHDFGRLFVHTVDIVKSTPLLHRAKSVEIEHPFRSARPLVLRIPFTGKGIVLGWWLNTDWDEDTALLEAVSGWGIDPYADDLDDPETRHLIRENIADSGLDLDDQWQIITALGVAE